MKKYKSIETSGLLFLSDYLDNKLIKNNEKLRIQFPDETVEDYVVHVDTKKHEFSDMGRKASETSRKAWIYITFKGELLKLYLRDFKNSLFLRIEENEKK